MRPSHTTVHRQIPGTGQRSDSSRVGPTGQAVKDGMRPARRRIKDERDEGLQDEGGDEGPTVSKQQTNSTSRNKDDFWGQPIIVKKERFSLSPDRAEDLPDVEWHPDADQDEEDQPKGSASLAGAGDQAYSSDDGELLRPPPPSRSLRR